MQCRNEVDSDAVFVNLSFRGLGLQRIRALMKLDSKGLEFWWTLTKNGSILKKIRTPHGDGSKGCWTRTDSSPSVPGLLTTLMLRNVIML